MLEIGVMERCRSFLLNLPVSLVLIHITHLLRGKLFCVIVPRFDALDKIEGSWWFRSWNYYHNNSQLFEFSTGEKLRNTVTLKCYNLKLLAGGLRETSISEQPWIVARASYLPPKLRDMVNVLVDLNEAWFPRDLKPEDAAMGVAR